MRYLNHRFAPGLLVLVASAFVSAACSGGNSVAGESSTSPPADPGPATIRIVQDGGCQMMGPNCPTYELDRDGTVRLYRTGQTEVVAEAAVSAEVTEELWGQITVTDMAALIERAGPGTCQACVDGVDTVVTFTKDGAEVKLDSTVIAFDSAEPLFAVFGEVIEALAAAAPMPIEQR